MSVRYAIAAQEGLQMDDDCNTSIVVSNAAGAQTTNRIEMLCAGPLYTPDTKAARENKLLRTIYRRLGVLAGKRKSSVPYDVVLVGGVEFIRTLNRTHSAYVHYALVDPGQDFHVVDEEDRPLTWESVDERIQQLKEENQK